MKKLLVKDLMTSHVITLDADDDLDLADMIMETARIRHLPVVRNDRLVGLVTHRDLLRASISSVVDVDQKDQDTLRKQIKTEQIMVDDVVTTEPEASALEAAQSMLDLKIGCMPVVRGDAQLVGIITESDFLELAIRAMKSIESRDD